MFLLFRRKDQSIIMSNYITAVKSLGTKKDINAGYGALAIVSFFWGTTYIASKIGASHMPGLFVAGVRQFISGFIMVSYFLAKGYKLPPLKDLKKIAIQGIFLLCIANGLLTWSLEYITVGLQPS